MEISGELIGMLEQEHVVEGQQEEGNNDKKADITCSVCNTSFEDYKKTGKLGCSRCYSTFEKQLKPIIEGIYGYSEHIGKFPKN